MYADLVSEKMQVLFPIPQVKIVSGRQDFGVQMCRGTRVLHLGCADDGVLHERYASGELLRLKLVKAARELWGVDISQQGIEFLSSQGIPTVHASAKKEYVFRRRHYPAAAKTNGEPAGMIGSRSRSESMRLRLHWLFSSVYVQIIRRHH
jgi:hypothetical protein